MTTTSASRATATVVLPLDGALHSYGLGEPGPWQRPTRPIESRIAYAAAHVVPRALGDTSPGAPADLDWDTTLAYRHELWSYGLGVADAMDTAQRGMGLDWPATRELIRRSGREAATVGGRLACGAGTDQLDLAAVPPGARGLGMITDAYREQIAVVREAGANVILMASRALAAVATSPADYLSVYGTLLAEADRPVILHWLGEMFDPALRGYWGDAEIERATATFRELIRSHADKVDGVKVSLLDAAHEVALRRALPDGVRLYTGDDFNYPELIVGDGFAGRDHSDALLGIFAAIYPAASTALQHLDAGEPARALEILESTRALGRHIFAAPTYYYKTGIAFLAWLNGHQRGFTMVGGLASGRSVSHLCKAFMLADHAGLLTDPDLAAHRMRTFLTVNGVG
ncbi:dihydrodipicolinate synthase family protein [Mycobacterium sp. PS03-16]|uniref:dihydrodipicolinate synthase family protein n=1 Tax=Mycobacterium sp. PS03-16 TaxID=2559611 RepID=UPI0010733A00|nr:dihydrodipicolinate synthase family protein [Mycobacterium sp. PS03-16]TFV54998.1 dihydrodipicolinate synthase family protein [Mycobacterium sp. PS03-16]